MTKFLRLAFTVVLLAGCATSPEPVAGADYPAISVLTEMPGDVEFIANLWASSDAGSNPQRRYDNAVEDLKKHAASLGANAIVVTDRTIASETTCLPQSNGIDRVMRTDIVNVEGTAIVVK